MSDDKKPVCSIIVSARDRFSSTEDCLDNILARTPEPHDLIVVLGGAPEGLRRSLREKYGDRARFFFEDRYLNCAQARNIGLRAAKTALAACLDNDVYPRPGWLAPLLACQKETGAGAVVPLILEDSRHIHTAGAYYFVTRKGGRAFASKALPFFQHMVYEGTSLKRTPADYAEMHCQLVDVKAALELGVLDERIQEGEELDSGLTWTKAGRSIWLEPASVVVFDFPIRVEDPMDIPLFKWRWNIRGIIPGYRVMHEKWGMDMTEAGDFKYFLMRINAVLGWLPRVWPTKTALAVDRAFARLMGLSSIPDRIWRHLMAWHAGYYDWVEAFEDPRPPRRRIADEIRRLLPGSGDGRRGTVTVPVSDGVAVDVCWRESTEGFGPAASVRADGVETLRFECFGDGKGGWRTAPGARKRWEPECFYFTERSVEEQIERTAREIRAHLAERRLDAEAEAAACERVEVELRRAISHNQRA